MAIYANSDIHAGQCFLRNHVAWKVDHFTSLNGIPHVGIMKVSDPTVRKVVSLNTLRDDYELAPDMVEIRGTVMVREF